MCCVSRLSWLIIYVALIAVVTVIITLICWQTSLFANCNIIILFLLCFLYGLTMIFLSFLVTSFFRKAELAGNVSSLVAMAFGFFYMAVVYTRDFSHRDGPVSAVPPWCQWLSALLSPVAYTLALDQVSTHFSAHSICSLYILRWCKNIGLIFYKIHGGLSLFWLPACGLSG